MNKILLFTLLFLVPSIAGAATKKKSSKPAVDPETVFEKGKEAFYNYDFEEAEEQFEEYQRLQEKKKKPVDPEFEDLERQLGIASNAFDRVEKIVVIDSISVPADDFYKYYKISKSSGKLQKGKGGAVNLDLPENEFSFSNDSDDYFIWSEPGSEGFRSLKEGIRLISSDWIIEDIRFSEQEEGINYIFPFMSPDGQTLYFASDGPGSMGGYDLFVAQRDPISGEFKQPLNMGMPFNSPYDDLLMAVDEENGIGWWATDRNSGEGKITVYVYLLNDIRRNYPSDTENLVSLARLDDFKMTQTGQDGQPLESIPSVPQIAYGQKATAGDFYLNMGGGKVYRSLKDFKNKKAAQQMSLYLKKENELESEQRKLRDLRMRYKSNDKGLMSEIGQLEKKVEQLRLEAKALKSEVYRLERS